MKPTKKYIAYLNRLAKETQKLIEEDQKKYNIKSTRVSLRDNGAFVASMYEGSANMGD